jgi:hypothetical protein
VRILEQAEAPQDASHDDGAKPEPNQENHHEPHPRHRLVANVALTTFTNYLNEVAGTEIDFPVVAHRAR